MGTKMEGVSRFESVTQPGSSWNAAFGAVCETPAWVFHGVPNAQVPVGVQFAAPEVEEATQFGGKAGAVTASNPSHKSLTKNGVGVGVEVGTVAVGEGEGVPVGVGVGVGEGVVGGVGVGDGPGHPAIEIVSTRHPGAPMTRSVPIRKRSLIVCPFRFGPRFITVLMYPPELPDQAIRPASGLRPLPSSSPV